MNETMTLVLALVAGFMLGAFFFGGLWWTIQKGFSSQKPAFWFVVSLLLRTGIVLTGFYFISDGHWQRLLTCLLGFIVARHIIVRLTQKKEKPNQLRQESGHAS